MSVLSFAILSSRGDSSDDRAVKPCRSASNTATDGNYVYLGMEFSPWVYDQMLEEYHSSSVNTFWLHRSENKIRLHNSDQSMNDT